MSSVSFAIWAFVAGGLIPVMGIINAGLARGVGGPVPATVVLFATGLLAALSLALATQARIPSLATLGTLPVYQYTGGLIVSFYVVSITFLAPRFGIGNAILFAVSAQLVTAAAIDHYAFLGAALRPLTPIRAVGLVIVIAGVVLTQAGDRLVASFR
jgi:transporter family-2 protein